MSKHLIFDTETSGMLQFAQPDNSPTQPRLVQLACVLLDDKFEEVSCFSTLIEPAGWKIEPGAEAVHGISLEKCVKHGIPAQTALSVFSAMASQADHIVAHNLQFDSRIINVECCRLNCGLMKWEPPRCLCTMKLGTDVCKIPHPKYHGKFKWPKLAEAVQILCGEVLEKAHDALADVRGCAKVYRKLVEGKYV